ncbi:GTP-binding protein gtr2 [Tilletia horrida]|uniref:GTP-binding protein n=1 Tax=Tilletia horrida TaxID=155126 RepID=A0AAN6GFD7_9BASI|nr:GTP-binding protein gtr2 [Tilletia horrida]KAK0540472.1 GTP-binding protein gtr2 [Tilletia horrida]KAK0564539.1 GTP-binding protein gtr2 [Tilletia horrida]
MNASLEKNNVVVLGRRRAGKTSIVRTLVDHLDPKNAVGMDPTPLVSTHEVASFIPLTLWDTPGATREDRAPLEHAPFVDRTDLPWTDVCALIYVVDSQDDVFHQDIVYYLLDAFEHNPKISFHIFIHKIDGHSDEYSHEILQTVSERVDADLEYELGEALPKLIKRKYHMTSIYDTSLFVAFSRVIRELLQANTFAQQLDALCDRLNSTCSMERTYIFDIPNRLYLATDNSPSDGNSFSTMSAYLKFLIQLSEIYSKLRDTVDAGEEEDDDDDESNQAAIANGTKQSQPTAGRYASSTARLTKDISLAFWQLNNSLALVTMLRTDTFSKQAGLIEYNISFFRRGVVKLYELAQLQGPVLTAEPATAAEEPNTSDVQRA